MYEHRHASAGQIKDRSDLTPVLEAVGVDVDAVWAEVDSGRPLATVEKEHTTFVDSHTVWGVPTFVVGDQAVFVRLLERPEGDADEGDGDDRAAARPDRLADAQRVQAHVDPPLASTVGAGGATVRRTGSNTDEPGGGSTT